MTMSVSIFKSIPRHAPIALAIAALLAAAATPARADSGTASTISGVQNFGGIDVRRQDCAGCVNEAERTDTFQWGASRITTYAQADYGVLKAAVSATGSGLGTRATANATALFVDSFVIDAAGLTGQQGHFTAQISVPFTTAVSTERMTTGGLQAYVRVNTIETWGLQFAATGGMQTTSLHHNADDAPLGTPMILNVPFTYGQAIPILGFLDTGVTGEAPPIGGSFATSIDAAHSLYWNGISTVTDRFGNAVTGYSLTSESGTDWRQDFQAAAAVPEPGSWVLLVGGLGVLGWRGRSGRR